MKMRLSLGKGDDWEETTQLKDVIETRFIPPKEIQEKESRD